MIDQCWIQKYVDCRLDAVLNAPLKGTPQTFYYGGAGTFLSNGIQMPDYNSVNVLIIPPSGTGVTADLHVQGSVVNGGYLDLSDPNAVTTGITTRKSIDVIVGTEWMAIKLANVAGTYDAHQTWQITVTPYVSPGQTRVQATIVVDSLSAITAITGSLEVTGTCTIDAGGSLKAGGGAITLDSTGIAAALAVSIGPNPGNAFHFTSAGTDAGGLYGYATAGKTNIGALTASGTGLLATHVSPGNDTVTLTANSSPATTITVSAAGTIAFSAMGVPALTIAAGGTTTVQTGTFLAAGTGDYPASGQAVGIELNSAVGFLYAFDWGTNAYLPLNLDGNPVKIGSNNPSGVYIGAVATQPGNLAGLGCLYVSSTDGSLHYRAPGGTDTKIANGP